MNLLADEDVDRSIVERLRRDGCHVEYVAEMQPGLSDEDVLHLANQQGALLLTADKDFGQLVFRQGRAASGVVLIRLAGVSPNRKAEIVSSALAAHAREMQRKFSVIDPGSVRIRPSITEMEKGSAD